MFCLKLLGLFSPKSKPLKFFQATGTEKRNLRRPSYLVEKLIRGYPAGLHLDDAPRTSTDALLAQRQTVLRKMLGYAQMLQENLNKRFVLLFKTITSFQLMNSQAH